jgi:hypothetical protein
MHVSKDDLDQILACLLYVARNHKDSSVRSSSLILRDELMAKASIQVSQ